MRKKIVKIAGICSIIGYGGNLFLGYIGYKTYVNYVMERLPFLLLGIFGTILIVIEELKEK